MPLTINDPHGGNTVEISEELRAKAQGSIILGGSGNHVRIADTAGIVNLYVRLGHRCRFEIGPDFNCQGLNSFQARDAVLDIGRHLVCNGKLQIVMHEPSTLRIGDDCLLADHILMTTSDMHSILDAESGKRINPARDVIIGDRVWLGLHALILKGSQIGSGSIVGAGSVVSGAIPENCSAAGNPARILRSGVTWDRELL